MIAKKIAAALIFSVASITWSQDWNHYPWMQRELPRELSMDIDSYAMETVAILSDPIVRRGLATLMIHPEYQSELQDFATYLAQRYSRYREYQPDKWVESWHSGANGRPDIRLIECPECFSSPPPGGYRSVTDGRSILPQGLSMDIDSYAMEMVAILSDPIVRHGLATLMIHPEYQSELQAFATYLTQRYSMYREYQRDEWVESWHIKANGRPDIRLIECPECFCIWPLCPTPSPQPDPDCPDEDDDGST